MKIFKKNEISFLKKLFLNKNNPIKISTKNIIDFKKTNNKLNAKNLNLNENKFPTMEENISNLLSQLEKENSFGSPDSLNQYLTQKDDIIFINNSNNEKIKCINNIKLGEVILLNGKYFAKCLAINPKITTFVLFDKIKYNKFLDYFFITILKIILIKVYLI